MVPAKSKFKDTVKDKLGKVDYSVSCSTSTGAHFVPSPVLGAGYRVEKHKPSPQGAQTSDCP